MSSWIRGRGKGRATTTPDLAPRDRVLIGVQDNLVSAQMSGGFGNRIFQILAGLGYAERTGKQFVFFEEHITNNPHTPPVKMRTMLYAWFPQVTIYRGKVSWTDYVDTGSPIPDMSGSVAIRGNFQNDAFFSPNARDTFKIPTPPQRILNVDSIDFTHAYFIHFRLGDYVGSDWDVDLTSYYPDAARRILLQDPSATFLVFTEEPDKVDMKKFKFPTMKMAMMPVVDIWETLWLMSRCNGGICANSTFSWIGGYASKGTGPFYLPNVWKRDGSARGLATWAITLPIKADALKEEPAKTSAPQIIIQELVEEVTPPQTIPLPTVEEVTPPQMIPLPTVEEVTPPQMIPLPTVEERVTVTDPTPALTTIQQSNKERKKNRSNNSE